MSEFTSKVARGAASEMLACAYLLERGYHVFRAISATCPVDLIAYRDGEAPIRVEVKTGNRAGGDVGNMNFSSPRNSEWDLLIVVTNGHVALLRNEGTMEDVREAYHAELAKVGIVRKVYDGRRAKSATHCLRGHELSGPNVYEAPTSGRLMCRPCSKVNESRRTRGNVA